jgi:hypothetical protein
MSDSRQTHQEVFGFGHGSGFEKVQGNTTLFTLNLLKHLLDSDSLDLG